MLNQTGIKKETFLSNNQILIAPDTAISFGCVVSQSLGVKDTATGKMIVKAGTPLAGNLDDRTIPFTKGTASDVVGILLHDVDVTIGDANSTIVVSGVINKNRIDATTLALLTPEVISALPKQIILKA